MPSLALDLLGRWVARCSLVMLTGVLAAACAPMDELDEDVVHHAESELRCSNAAATKLSSVARRREGRRSTGYCYRHVKAHLRAAGMSTADLESKGYGASAYKFTLWANKHPKSLERMGLKKVTLGLNELPKGAVIVWPRGMCGYNRQHGHIEVVVDDQSSRACSEFCGRIKKGCGTPDIFIPKGCTGAQPLEDDDDDQSEQAPAMDDDAADDESKTGVDDDAASCWSPTMEDDMAELSCVRSASSGVWFQCKEGKWYREVEGGRGPFGPCNGTFSR